MTLNAEDYFEVTAQSIKEAKDETVEWIVIDGKSSDGTINLIEKYSNLIDTLVIEKDDGIFDAMNKARGKINGRFLLFLNAGDRIINGTQLLACLRRMSVQPPDVVVGDCVKYHERSYQICKANLKNISKLSWVMPIIHQSMIFNIESIEKFNWYDARYKVVSDYDLLIRMVKGKCVFKYLGYPISQFYVGDYNWKNGITSLNEKYFMLKKHHHIFNLSTRLGYLKDVIKVLCIQNIYNYRLYKLYRRTRYGK